jgi:hypothetical protein
MAQEIIYLTGTTNWMSKKLGEKYGKYTHDLYLDDASKAVFKSSGIRVSPKEDKEGNTFYKLSRAETLEKKDGTIVDLGPPIFLNADGTPYEGLVGNGSTVTSKISVYDTGAGKGHRWEASRIDNLVVYGGSTAAPETGLPF